MEPIRTLSLRGAKQHNLKGFDLDLVLGQLTVICGVSGSGKTSLALNTLYAEGQRRYIESFSAYTRQFLARIEKPSFDSLTNLPPSIASTRELRTRNNRSTVGTVSEILEYLRVSFSNRSELRCYQCNRPVAPHSPRTVCDSLARLEQSRALVCFEIQWQTKSELSEILFDLQTSGFIRLMANGQFIHLAEDDRTKTASDFGDASHAYVVVDRLNVGVGQDSSRLMQSMETAFEHADEGDGRGVMVLVQTLDVKSRIEERTASHDSHLDQIEIEGQQYEVHRFSSLLRCQYCKIDYPASEPRLFNFNSPIGACATCEGFGEVVAIDMKKVVPDDSLSLNAGAIAVWRTPAYSHELDELRRIADAFRVPMDVPVSKLTAKQWRVITEGVPERKFGGLNGFFAWLERKKYKMHVRVFLARWRTYSLCPSCKGMRLNPGALAYKLFDRSFAELCDLSIDILSSLINERMNATSDTEAMAWKLDRATHASTSNDPPRFMLAGEARASYAASEPERQLSARLEYLRSVGLGYLCLARPTHTLSSGEAQRVMMTTLLGSSLVDMLYVFDEPTVGLHPQDTERIAHAILGLRDRGNTVVLVEHEPHLMLIADRILEIGPNAGEHGGEIVFDGTPHELVQSNSVTGDFLSGRRNSQRTPRTVGKVDHVRHAGLAGHAGLTEQNWIGLQGATGRNLRVEQLRIPLNCLTVVIGPSGSGKSSLILDTLCPALEGFFDEPSGEGLPLESLYGVERIAGCLAIDQSPIPRSLRSSPVTYSKALDDIRQAYAETPEAKARHFEIGHFSFNSELGRCPTCEGLGFITVEMQFMADVQLLCTDCDGKRFRAEVLEVRWRDRNIAEVLTMSVERAHAFFRGNAKVQEKLRPLMKIGLGYLPLGQSLSSLSAGESMRLKLASQLDFKKREVDSHPSKGKLIVLDEPTTGLHFSDVEKLLQCIDSIIDAGNSVLVIEHNQQMICAADHLIELGPGAGPDGGSIIAEGTVDQVLRNPASVTGRFLSGPKFATETF